MPQTIDLSWCQDLEEAALKKQQLQMEKEVREAEGKLNLGKKTRRKIRETPEYRKNAATAATTTRTYEHGFAAAAKPGAYVLVTKTC